MANSGVADVHLKLARLDCCAMPSLLHRFHDAQDLHFHGIGEGFHEVGAPERVDRAGHAGLEGQNLLGAERERGGLLARQCERLVPGRSEHRLHPSERRGHGLVRHTNDVVLGFLGIRRGSPADAADPEHASSIVEGVIALLDDPGPDPSSGTVLRNLLEEVAMGIEKERDLRSELVDGHASSADDLVAVGDAVSQRVRHLRQQWHRHHGSGHRRLRSR